MPGAEKLAPTSVLDASALLAVLHRENGAEVVAEAIAGGAAIGVVNLADTEAEAANAEIVVRGGDAWLEALPVTPVAPDEETALAEADADRAAGIPLVSHEEVMREFGLEQ